MEPVKDLRVSSGTSLKELMEQYGQSGGFTSAKLAQAHDILKMMLDGECIKFFSFPACINATGTRGVIKDMVKNKLVDVIITTCGTLDHDLARQWKHYYKGRFDVDDADLYDQGVNRLGNVFVPNESYGIVLEDKLQPFLEELYAGGIKEMSTKELCWELGKLCNEESILYWARENKIPIYIPGITDGAVGSQLWSFYQKHRDFKLDLFKDENDLADIVFTAKRTGALMVGGGISKHHTIWWNQFRDGLDYAVYLTTAVEHDGSLSGARVREAVSWGKVNTKAKYTTVEGDATILLPLLIAPFL